MSHLSLHCLLYYCLLPAAARRELITYLEALPGVQPIQPGFNPATWMLEVTGVLLNPCHCPAYRRT